MQLHNINDVSIPKPQYQTILDGREEQRAGESDVNSEYISASSVKEKMVVNGNYQDSDSESTNTYFMPLSSLNHLTSGPCLSLVLNGTETEVDEERQEEKDKCDDDDEVKDCEEESPKVTCETDGRSTKIIVKTGRGIYTMGSTITWNRFGLDSGLEWILDWTGISIIAISVFCTVLLRDFEQLSSSAG